MEGCFLSLCVNQFPVRSAISGMKSNPNAALRLDTLSLHVTPDLQLKTGAHNTAGLCSNKPESQLYTLNAWHSSLQQEQG